MRIILKTSLDIEDKEEKDFFDLNSFLNKIAGVLEKSASSIELIFRNQSKSTPSADFIFSIDWSQDFLSLKSKDFIEPLAYLTDNVKTLPNPNLKRQLRVNPLELFKSTIVFSVSDN